MNLLTGDKRRNLDLELIKEVHSILEIPAHPTPHHPEFLGKSVMDSTFLFGTTWTSFYIKWLSFVLFYLMTNLYRKLWLGLGCQWLKHHQCYKIRITSVSIGFKNIFGAPSWTWYQHNLSIICVVNRVTTTSDILEGNILVCQVDDVIV